MLCRIHVFSSVASPRCQEGQNERTFSIFLFSSQFFPLPDFSLFSYFSSFSQIFPKFFPLFPDFWQVFRCQGGTLAPFPPTGQATVCGKGELWPLPPYWPGYCMCLSSKTCCIATCYFALSPPLLAEVM